VDEPEPDAAGALVEDDVEPEDDEDDESLAGFESPDLASPEPELEPEPEEAEEDEDDEEPDEEPDEEGEDRLSLR